MKRKRGWRGGNKGPKPLFSGHGWRLQCNVPLPRTSLGTVKRFDSAYDHLRNNHFCAIDDIGISAARFSFFLHC